MLNGLAGSASISSGSACCCVLFSTSVARLGKISALAVACCQIEREIGPNLATLFSLDWVIPRHSAPCGGPAHCTQSRCPSTE